MPSKKTVLFISEETYSPKKRDDGEIMKCRSSLEPIVEGLSNVFLGQSTGRTQELSLRILNQKSSDLRHSRILVEADGECQVNVVTVTTLLLHARFLTPL